MDTNKNHPHPPKYFNPHLSKKKKNHNPSPHHQKISPLSKKINTPHPQKKYTSLTSTTWKDFIKLYMFSKHFIIFRLYHEKLRKKSANLK